MTGVRRNKCFIQNQCGILEPGIHIAKGPLVGRFTHGQAAFFRFGEVRSGPFEFSEVGRRGARRLLPGFSWRRLGPDPDVALGAWVRPAGAKTVERIDYEGKMLKLNVNAFDCLGSGKFVHSGYGQNRFALVQRLHCERFFALLPARFG